MKGRLQPRGSRDLVRNIDSKGSIFSIRKKTDEQERSFSMLVDKAGDLKDPFSPTRMDLNIRSRPDMN